MSWNFWQYGKELTDDEREERMKVLRRVFPSKADLAKSQWQDKTGNQKVNEDIQDQRNRQEEHEARKRLEALRFEAERQKVIRELQLSDQQQQARYAEGMRWAQSLNDAQPPVRPNGHTWPANQKPECNPFKRKMVL